MPAPPVAKTVAIVGWFIKRPVASIDGVVTHWIQFSGAPAATAASSTICAAAADDCCADGWKAKMIGLRVLIAIIDLKIVVDVGLVVGVTPQITPTGSAISTMPASLSSLITPTVLLSLMAFQIYSDAYIFLIALSS